MALIAFAVMSGVLQIAGYIFYALKTRRPNPLSWLMWAYGTTLAAWRPLLRRFSERSQGKTCFFI